MNKTKNEMMMKRTIISALFALFGVVLAQATEAVGDTTRIYIIDGALVEHFDGSILNGRTIKDYKITVVGDETKGTYDEIHCINLEVSPLHVDVNMKKDEKQGKDGYIRGKVVDEVNQAIVGCTIFPVNKTNKNANKDFTAQPKGGTVTDVDGNFEIKAKAPVQLCFSYVGYKTRYMYVVNGSYVTVNMVPDNQEVLLHYAGTKTIKKSLGREENDMKIVSIKPSGTADPIIFLNGNKISNDEMKQVNPDSINNITVLKAGTKAAKEYSEDVDKKGAILIELKK